MGLSWLGFSRQTRSFKKGIRATNMQMRAEKTGRERVRVRQKSMLPGYLKM